MVENGVREDLAELRFAWDMLHNQYLVIRDWQTGIEKIIKNINSVQIPRRKKALLRTDAPERIETIQEQLESFKRVGSILSEFVEAAEKILIVSVEKREKLTEQMREIKKTTE